MVQCHCAGEKEGWEFTLLYWLLQTQCTLEEGFIPTSMYPRDNGEPSRSGTLLLSWPKARFLADQNKWRVKVVCGLHLRFLECEQMPFGLCNAPATFQQLKQNCLGELNLTYCLIDLNDIIVFLKMEEEHCHHLYVVFNWFCEHYLKLKPTKCEFFKSKINNLGHHVLKDGVRLSQDNLKAITEWALP